MDAPNFDSSNAASGSQLLARIGDRVRSERKRLSLSQSEFAARCGIPLRSYKRFEAGNSDSLLILLKIVQYFKRTAAVGLLFPPPDVPLRGMDAALRSLRRKLDERVVTGEGILD